MARYKLALADEAGNVIAVFNIETDPAAIEAYYEANDADGCPDPLYGPKDFGEDVETEINANERNV